MSHSLDKKTPMLLAQAAILTVCAVVVAAVAGAALTSTNLVVGGGAVVVPRQQPARIQSGMEGRVGRLFVSEGQQVKLGEPLITLATPELDAKLNALRQRLGAQRGLLAAQQQLRELRGRALELAQAKAATSFTATKQAIAAAETTVATSVEEEERRTKRLEALAQLAKEGAIRELDFEAELYAQLQAGDRARQSLNHQGHLKLELSKVGQARASETLEIERAKLTDTIDIAQTTDLIATLEQELAIVTKQREDVALKAPYDGYVEKLSVHVPGEVVGAGQVIAEVIPSASDFRIEVAVPSKGVGLVRPGQEVRLKLDSFPYRDYGLARGVVQRVPTAATREDAVQNEYAVWVTVSKLPLDGSGKPVRLRSGMTGSAEMVVRKDKLFNVLLRPWQGNLDSVPVR